MAEYGDEDGAHVARLWQAALAALGPGWTVNGATGRRYRGNLNLRRDGLDVARLLSELREVALSSGSACASGSGRPSHVLSALGLADRQARASLRLGFGRYTREDELVRAIGLIVAASESQQSFAA